MNNGQFSLPGTLRQPHIERKKRHRFHTQRKRQMQGVPGTQTIFAVAHQLRGLAEYIPIQRQQAEMSFAKLAEYFPRRIALPGGNL